MKTSTKKLSLLLLLLINNVLSKDLKDKSHSKLKEQHDKIHKSEEEQGDYDKEVLFGGDDSYDKIHDLTDEEQREKLREFIVTKMDKNNDGFSIVDYCFISTKKMFAFIHNIVRFFRIYITLVYVYI